MTDRPNPTTAGEAFANSMRRVSDELNKKTAVGDEPADAPALGIVETLAVYVDEHVTIRLTNGDEIAGKLYGPVADHNGDLVALAFRRYSGKATPAIDPVSVIPWHAVALLERRR